MTPSAQQISKALRKYLERHAEPEARCAQPLSHRDVRYASVVVIPADGESELLPTTLASVPPCSSGRVLVVIVVNRIGLGTHLLLVIEFVWRLELLRRDGLFRSGDGTDGVLLPIPWGLPIPGADCELVHHHRDGGADV